MQAASLLRLHIYEFLLRLMIAPLIRYPTTPPTANKIKSLGCMLLMKPIIFPGIPRTPVTTQSHALSMLTSIDPDTTKTTNTIAAITSTIANTIRVHLIFINNLPPIPNVLIIIPLYVKQVKFIIFPIFIILLLDLHKKLLTLFPFFSIINLACKHKREEDVLVID